jgi:ferritin-like metal-binding protein YciE
MKDFFRLFVDELKEAYDCEQQILKAFPEIIQAANSEKLKKVLQQHKQETEEQLKRLNEISRELNENLEGVKCDAIYALLEEARKCIKTDYQKNVKDAALIGIVQHVEHHEIAVYGVLKTFAKHLKLDKVEQLLRETLKEEEKIDRKLTEIAEGTSFAEGINDKACKRKSA